VSPALPWLLQVTKVQRALVETWGIVREAFFDPTFNHQGKASLVLRDDKLEDAVTDDL